MYKSTYWYNFFCPNDDIIKNEYHIIISRNIMKKNTRQPTSKPNRFHVANAIRPYKVEGHSYYCTIVRRIFQT